MLETNHEETIIEQFNDGKIVVIKPKNHKLIPLFCPLCNFPLKTIDDILSYRQYDSCDLCSLNFAITNLKNWQNGWRPSKEELVDYLDNKEKVSRPIFILR